jgi:hypothetical protein
MRKKINLTLLGLFISYGIYIIAEISGYFKNIDLIGSDKFTCHYLEKE